MTLQATNVLSSLSVLFVLLVLSSTFGQSYPLIPELQARQAPNVLYPSDPSNQTASLNFTSFLLPISLADAKKLAGSRKFLPPQGLPHGLIDTSKEWPLIVTVGLLHDVRQATLEIKNLQLAQSLLPFVDGSGDGKTPYVFEVMNYQNQLVPVLAGSLQQGIALELGNFDPAEAAFKSLNGGKKSSYTVALGLENSDSLLGVPTPDEPVINALWSTTPKSRVSSKFFKGVLMAPYIHTYSGKCSATKFVFDESFAEPYYVVAENLQTSSPTTPTSYNAKSVHGWHVAAAWDNPFGGGQDCSAMKSLAQSIEYS